MLRSFKTLAVIFMLFAAVTSLHADERIKIKIKQPPPNMLGVGDMWNLTLENTTKSDLKIYLTGTATEEKDGLIIEGKSKVFTIKPGKTNYKYNDFPGAEVKYNNGKYKEIILRTGNAPEGSYTICVTAFEESGEVAGMENCIMQTVQQLGSITLISPEDKAELDPDTLPGLMFSWTPLPNGGPYSLRIVELKGDQSPDVAIKESRPILDKEGITATNYQYSLSDPKLEAGKKYAWQVSSGSVSSEVYKLIVSNGQNINLTLIPRNCEDCCFDIQITGNFNMFNAFRLSNAYTNITSVTPAPGYGIVSQTSSQVILKPNSGPFITNTIVGVICYDPVPNPFLAAVAWSTNSGAIFMMPVDSFSIQCAPPCGSSICDSLSATASTSPGQGNCCGQISLSHPQNTTGIKKIQFKPLPSGINTFASASLTNMTGWSPNVSNPNEYKVMKSTGFVPPGQLNGFFTFCLNALSSPQYVVVNWLSSTDSVICSDTVNVNCDIPCVTFTKDTVECNGNNYNLTYSFTNNSNFTMSNISYTVIPSTVTVNPLTTILSTPVTSTNSSGNITIGLSGATPNSNVCVVMRFQSPDSCCWCYDTLCVTIPPACICDSVGATLTGDPNSCCYNLNLTNNYQANYFTQVNLSCITAGVTISTFSFNSNWGSSSVFPPTLAQVVHNSNFIPLGTSNNIGSLCFAGVVNPPQYILVEWIRNDSVKCVDTLRTDCRHIMEENDCAQIVNDTIICLPDGTFQYTFQVQNNDNTHTATGFQLNPIPPSGVILSQLDFPAVSILPNATSSPQTIIIGGIGQNTQFCFEVAVYQHVGNSYSWCCHGDTVCVTTPVCGETDCLETTLDSIWCIKDSLGVKRYGYSIDLTNYTATTNTYVLSNSCGTFSGINYGSIPGGNTITHTGQFTTTQTGNCCITAQMWIPVGPQNIDTCYDTLCFALPKDCGTTQTGCNFQVGIDSITCAGTAPNGSPLFKVWSAINNLNSSMGFLHSVHANGNVASVFSPNLTPGMTYSQHTYYGQTSGNVCFEYWIMNPNNPMDTCKYTVCKVLPDCPPVGCNCGTWNGGISINGYWYACNQSPNFTFNSGNLFIQGPTMQCNPNSPNCQVQQSYSVLHNQSQVYSGNGNSISGFSFQRGQTYDIIFNANCGGIQCPPCRTTIRIKNGIFGGTGGVVLGDIGIKKPNVFPTVMNPSGSVRPDFGWSNSGNSKGKKLLCLVEIKPGSDNVTLSDELKMLTDTEPLFEVMVESNSLKFPEEAKDLTSGSYYLWVVYETDEKGNADILESGLFKAGTDTAGVILDNCDSNAKKCKSGRRWEIDGKCICF